MPQVVHSIVWGVTTCCSYGCGEQCASRVIPQLTVLARVMVIHSGAVLRSLR
mgnify:CR=1 FL=1